MVPKEELRLQRRWAMYRQALGAGFGGEDGWFIKADNSRGEYILYLRWVQYEPTNM